MLIYFHCTHFPLGRFQLVTEQAHSLLAGWRSARQTVDPAVAYFSLFWPGLGLSDYSERKQNAGGFASREPRHLHLLV